MGSAHLTRLSLKERRTRGTVKCSVQEIRGISLVFREMWDTAMLFRQCLDEHLNDLIYRLLFSVAQRSIFANFDYPDTSISHKHPQELRSLFKGKSFRMREVGCGQIAAPEHIDIKMKQDGSGSRYGCKHLLRQFPRSNAANVGEREGAHACLLRLSASSPTDLRDLRRLERGAQ